LLTNVVARLLPFHCNTELEMNPEPFTVSVNAAPPAPVLEGESEVTVGTGLLTVKVTVFEVPPPDAGLKTATWAGPPVPMSLAGIEALSCMLLTNVVARLLPFHCNTELEMNPEPFTVSVNAAPPAAALLGESDVMEGCGGADPPHAARQKKMPKVASGLKLSFLITASRSTLVRLTLRRFKLLAD